MTHKLEPLTGYTQQDIDLLDWAHLEMVHSTGIEILAEHAIDPDRSPDGRVVACDDDGRALSVAKTLEWIKNDRLFVARILTSDRRCSGPGFVHVLTTIGNTVMRWDLGYDRMILQLGTIMRCHCVWHARNEIGQGCGCKECVSLYGDTAA
jgi:hypothetical protein